MEISKDFLDRLKKLDAYLCPEPDNYWSVNDISDDYPGGFKRDINEALEQAEKNYKEWLKYVE